VADRVWWAGANDSFVKGFWELRLNISEVVMEMAAQTLMLNVDRCTKNHVYAHLNGASRRVHASSSCGVRLTVHGAPQRATSGLLFRRI
jgi:hypothetical protein